MKSIFGAMLGDTNKQTSKKTYMNKVKKKIMQGCNQHIKITQDGIKKAGQ